MTLMDVFLKNDEMLYDCFNYVIEKLNIWGLSCWQHGLFQFIVIGFVNSMATTWLT
jgi:hypothetical protein